MIRIALAAALSLALMAPASAAFISATPPRQIPVYPGCPIPPVSWTATASSSTNQVWYIDPVGGNNSNNGMTKATAWHDISALTTAGVSGGGGSNAHALLVSVDPVNGVVKGGDEVLLETGTYGAVSISPAAQATNSPEVTLAADAGATPQLMSIFVSKSSGWVFRGLKIQQTVFPVTTAAIRLSSSSSNNVNDIIFVGNDVSNHTEAAFDSFVANFTGTYTASTNILNVTAMLPGATSIVAGMQASWIDLNNAAPSNGITIAPFGTGGTTGTGSVGTYQVLNAVPSTAVSSASWAANVITFNLSSPLPESVASGVQVVTTGFTPAGYNGTFTLNATASAGASSITVTATTNPGTMMGAGSLSNMADYPGALLGPHIMSVSDPVFSASNTDDILDETGGVGNSTSSCHSYDYNRFHNSFFTLITTTDKLLIKANEFDHWSKSMWESYLSNTIIADNHFHDTISTLPNHPDLVQVLQELSTGPATFPNIVYTRNYYNEHEDAKMPFTNGSFGLVDGSKFRTPFSNLSVTDNVFVTSNFDTVNWSLSGCLNCTIANNTLVNVNAAAPYSPTNTHADITMTDAQLPAPTAATWSAGVATITDSIGAAGIVAGVPLYLHGWTPSGYNGTWTVAATALGGATSITLNMPSDPGGAATIMGGIGFQSTNIVVRNNLANVMTLTMPFASPVVDHNTLAACVGTGCGTANLYSHYFSTDGSVVNCSVTCNDTSGNPTQIILAQGALNSSSVWETWNPTALSFLFAPLSSASAVVRAGALPDSNYTAGNDLYGVPWTSPPNLGASRCYNPTANAC